MLRPAEVAKRTEMPLHPPLLLCFLALSLPALSADQLDLQGVYALDRTASDSIDQAIENGTAAMNFVIRPLARSRIAKTNPLYQRVQISREHLSVRVQFDADAPIQIPLDGRAVRWVRQDNGTYDVTAAWTADRLVMYFKAGDGQRTNTFDLDPDATRMKLAVDLASTHLPGAIHYVLAYRRLPQLAGEPARPAP
jgi:hypothetical protein